ncbi:ABC transporter substrate-binding protein [Bradyrhizobium sp. LTSP849]|uniref:ABC transporter substrate-binding protein n=1 Tax=Bradyrhizobium sp. LTSP849 TaxID=1615890 RepID=UPI0005D2331C|nr:ABC transporter substrate-binding protein [Bradyrhizobium sp. LTSP849]KJC40185.1 ABC transporter substrate-binding protein [Bradyrhizobium sp. LTSP849]
MRTFWIIVLTVMAAGWARAQEQPHRGGTLVVRLNSDIRSLEPGINRDGQTDTVVNQIFEGLVAYRSDLSVGPALADSWTVSDDGKIYTFKLRPGVRFHNGAPLTSADVKWSWDRQVASPGWLCRRSFDGGQGLKVEAVETPSPDQIVYRLAEPNALFLGNLANIQCGVLVSNPASAEGASWTPIGTGPLKLKDWKRGESITLERFADYSPSKAEPSGFSGARVVYVDKVVFRVIPDDSVAEAALQTGAIDVTPEIAPERAPNLKQRGVTIFNTPGLSWAALLVQTTDPLFSNPKMRLALAHAINRAELAEVGTAGLSQANSSSVSDSSSFYDDSFAAWPTYDPKQAQGLAREAGYAGQTIKIQTNKRYSRMYQNSILIQAMLAQAGFKAELEVLDWATQLDRYLKGNFQLQSFGYSARFDPSQMYASWIGDKSANAWAQWEDPNAIRILASSTASTNASDRKAAFKKLHAMVQEQVPIVGLYYDPVIEGVSPSVKNYKIWAANKTMTWGVWKDR